jgi:hypothetical protein
VKIGRSCKEKNEVSATNKIANMMNTFFMALFCYLNQRSLEIMQNAFQKVNRYDPEQKGISFVFLPL